MTGKQVNGISFRKTSNEHHTLMLGFHTYSSDKGYDNVEIVPVDVDSVSMSMLSSPSLSSPPAEDASVLALYGPIIERTEWKPLPKLPHGRESHFFSSFFLLAFRLRTYNKSQIYSHLSSFVPFSN